MVKTVTRRKSQSPMAAKLVAYLAAKQAEKDAKRQIESLKKDLSEFVDQYHEEDPEAGHWLHTLPDEVNFNGQRFTGFMKQKKSGGQVFLEDKAEALCKKRKFDLDDYTTRYVDQDKIVRLYAEDKITQAEFDALYQNNDPTWAFVPIKE